MALIASPLGEHAGLPAALSHAIPGLLGDTAIDPLATELLTPSSDLCHEAAEVEGKAGVVAPPLGAEVPVIEADVLESMRLLEQRGWGIEKIA